MRANSLKSLSRFFLRALTDSNPGYTQDPSVWRAWVDRQHCSALDLRASKSLGFDVPLKRTHGSSAVVIPQWVMLGRSSACPLTFCRLQHPPDPGAVWESTKVPCPTELIPNACESYAVCFFPVSSAVIRHFDTAAECKVLGSETTPVPSPNWDLFTPTYQVLSRYTLCVYTIHPCPPR